MSKIKNYKFILKIIWSVSPLRVILTYVMTFLSFAIWTFYTVFFMRYIFGGETNHSFGEIMMFVWIVVGVNILYQAVLSWYNNIFVPLENIKIQRGMNEILFDKVKTIDISCYENPDFYDSYTRANIETVERSLSVLQTSATLLSSLISSVYVIYTMCSITWLVLPFISFPIVGNLYFGKKLADISYKIKNENIPAKRKQDYINRVVYLRQYAEEVRLTSVFEILNEMYEEAVKQKLNVYKKYAFKNVLYNMLSSFLQFPLAFQGLWFLSAFLALHTHSISLGEFIVLSSSIVSITWMIRSYTDSMIKMFSDSFFIENLKSFLNYIPLIDESSTEGIEIENIGEIEFRNVSFRYPGKKEYVLQNVSFCLLPHTINVIVGRNGSGKSTLIKLLLRLYDPSEGKILVNGIDIKKYNLQAYRKMIAVTFQDFSLFSYSVWDNILMKPNITEDEKKQISNAAHKSGILNKILQFEKGFDSVLTKEFENNGIELSGGEKQRLALTRTFAKNVPVVVLDEPSSALDPLAEQSIYEKIFEYCNDRNKISILVSHRLSVCSKADNILLFEDGYLKEIGSHNFLMKLNGKYAEMYNRQSENY